MMLNLGLKYVVVLLGNVVEVYVNDFIWNVKDSMCCVNRDKFLFFVRYFGVDVDFKDIISEDFEVWMWFFFRLFKNVGK